MFLQSLSAKFTKRDKKTPLKEVRITENTLTILKLVFEYKILNPAQASAFLYRRADSKYIYRKMKELWDAGLLESVPLFIGEKGRLPIFYLLSRRGYNLLKDTYPDMKGFFTAKRLTSELSSGILRHDTLVVDLSCDEYISKKSGVTIEVMSEVASNEVKVVEHTTAERFTPDYTAIYTVNGKSGYLFTEVERSKKSEKAYIAKFKRYLDVIPVGNLPKTTVRLIFSGKYLEEYFWNTGLSSFSGLFERIKIITTNVEEIEHKGFFGEIYLSKDLVSSEKTITGKHKLIFHNRKKLLKD